MHVVPIDQLRQLVYGAAEIEEADGLLPLRIPRSVFPQFPNPAIGWVVSQTAGVSLRMRTASTRLRLRAHFTRNIGPYGLRRPSVLTAEVDGIEVWRATDDGGDLILGQLDGGVDLQSGSPSLLDIALPPGPSKLVEIRLPHRSQTRLIEFWSDAVVTSASSTGRPRWTHHGSSISQGHEADAPSSVWTHQVAHTLGWELTDRAFAGNAMLDPFAAREIARVPADLITIKVGVNIVAGDTMRERAFVPAVHGFLDVLRDAQPRVPIILLSAVVCPPIEDHCGPLLAGPDGRFRVAERGSEDDGVLTLQRTRALLGEVVARRQDPLLGLLDGRELLGSADAGELVDGLHPSQRGHDLMAQHAVRIIRAGRFPDLLPHVS